jgi:hypothetical protein
VRFRLSDVFLPSREELLLAWPGEAEVEGTIVEFSDSGSMPRTFAVVEVLRRQAVVVPVLSLQILAPRGSNTRP